MSIRNWYVGKSILFWAIAADYYRPGMAYYHKGDQTLALKTLRKALELDQSFPGAQEASRALREIEILKGLE